MRIPVFAILFSSALIAAEHRDIILADKPAAYWRFDDARDCCADDAGGDKALAADRGTNVSLIADGPRPPGFPNFEAHNVAADFTQAPLAFLRVKDPGAKSVFDFATGETITAEAWVQCRGPLKDWQFVYIVGKGRTTGGSNQNWGLRLLGDGKLARASFIFSGATTGRFHRWNSNLGFALGDDWHHVAVSYEFGKPESIRAWLDGRASAGVWDDGGATNDAPVVDDDEVWIGSSMNGQASSTFPGAIDEVAIYRSALDEARIRAHATREKEAALVDCGPKSDASKTPVAKKPEPPPAPVPAIALAELPPGKVRVEIFEFPTTPGEDSTEFWTTESGKKSTAADPSWAALPPNKTEQWNEPAWLLAALPTKYNERAVKTERSRPFLVRMAGAVTLPPGENRILLRALTGTRLALDGQVLTQTPLKKLNKQDNDPVPDQLEQQLVKDMPLLPPGHVEREAKITSDGKPRVLVVESWVGGKSIRPEIGELFVSAKTEDGWRLLGSAVKLSTEGAEGHGKGAELSRPSANFAVKNETAKDAKDAKGSGSESPAKIDPAQEAFVTAYLSLRKAGELEAGGDIKGALDAYGKARDELEAVRTKHPTWQPEIVAFRLERSKEAIARLGRGNDGANAKPDDSGISPEQEAFVTAYLSLREAEDLESGGDVKGALKIYRDALKEFRKIERAEPQWRIYPLDPNSIEATIKRLERAIKRIEGLDEKDGQAAGLDEFAVNEIKKDSAAQSEKIPNANDAALVQSFSEYRDAEIKEWDGDPEGALVHFKDMGRRLADIQKRFPDFESGMVAFRIRRIGEAVERLERMGVRLDFPNVVRSQQARVAKLDAKNRRVPAEDAYWKMRHDLARENTKPAPRPPRLTSHVSGLTPIDAFLEAKQPSKTPLVGSAAFLRRVTLDTIGRIPTAEEVANFLANTSTNKRAAAIERLLADPRWADHWTSYWQDVLAENPNMLKGTLNNTGPFRWWIHESLLDNKPMDRFVTELIAMEGSANYGGPAGFGIATQNDLPMAAKAQVISSAFLANEMKCARCHDAVNHSFEQRELFQVAAMLGRAPLKVPETSLTKGLSKNSHVTVTLKAGEIIEPHMPFGAVKEPLPGVLRGKGDSREMLAALLTDPRNERFAQVIVNRIWKQFMGFGIVEPVDDWETSQPSHPELLRWLAREFIANSYDVKHIARLILNSAAYQRAVTPDASREVRSSERTFSSQTRRRLTAEQLLDSLMLAAGQEYETEMLTFDPEARQNAKDQGNFGVPRRAWEFAPLANERDRPALAKPRAQMFADVLAAFGWRESRPEPRSTRDHEANIIQPALLANGTFGALITRAHDDSALTALALRELPVSELVRSLYHSLLSRSPSAAEEKRLTALLAPGYESRLTRAERAPKLPPDTKAVSWASHLNPEATTAVLAAERAVKAGPPPTPRLTSDWCDRFEDAVWALLVSPEFAWVP